MAKNWMQKVEEKEKRRNEKSSKAYTLIVEILNKYHITDGISSFTDCSQWPKLDQRQFLKGLIMDGYSEQTVRQLYKFSI